MNKTFANKIIPLGLVFLALVIVMPRNPKFAYDYKKGKPWKYETLFAKFDFPIYKTDDQIREERGSSAPDYIPYYKYSDDIVNRSLKSAEGLNLGPLRTAVVADLRDIYDRGVMSDEGVKDSKGDVICIQRDKKAIRHPVTDVYKQADAKAKLLADITALTNANVDSIFRVTGIYDLVVPNVIFDQQTTNLVHSESNSNISPTSGYVTAGQLIVSNGEVVTAEIEQMLDSYKRESEANIGYLGPPVMLWLGNFIIALAIVALLYLAIYFGSQSVFEDQRYNYILVIFALCAICTLVLIRIDEKLLLFFPFTLSALMLQAFMKQRVIIPVYFISLLPLLIFSHDGTSLFVMYLVAGIVAIYVFRYFQRGWKQFVTALITFFVLAIVYLGFRAADLVAGDTWTTLIRIFIGSMLTVAGYPLVYLFERVFNLVSNSRLLELCDTSNPIIRELEQKAPGTFQHSLQVMNMADAAARAVDENPDLVRAGALYHDIGKMNNPLCFVENESLLAKEDSNKYHFGLPPIQSAHDIIKHVADGVEIARKNDLPSVVIDFIRSHHGTTTVKYFYNKFIEQGGDPSRIGEFKYNEMKPETKAQIIVMLCDSLEAASRTLKSYTPEAYSNFVEEIVADKMEEGQFDKADISISELSIVKETLKQYLAQINHERIVYPKNN